MRLHCGVLAALMAALMAAGLAGCAGKSADQTSGAKRDIAFGIGRSTVADPYQAGRAAAEMARSRVGAAAVKAVILAESFEDRERKEKVLAGVCSVFPAEMVYGSTTYGGFTQEGVMAGESAAVLAVAGQDIEASAALQRDLGVSDLTVDKHMAQIEEKLSSAGESLGRRLPLGERSRLLLVFADAHSPKNGALVAGLRRVTGNDFAITGGSANKNAGQTFVYHHGQMHRDSAVGLMLSGEFAVGMAGRQAKENDRIIATAREGAAQALAELQRQKAAPAVVLAFDCAGRKGRLKNLADEWQAMRQSLGTQLPLFGTYNAGEVGPADLSERQPHVRCSGVGWHVMFTAIGF